MSKQSTLSKQPVKICFFEFECWRCSARNHIYYAYRMNNEDSSSRSLGYQSDEDETLWDGESLVFKPEIVAAVNNYLKSDDGKGLLVGAIKKRYSATVGDSYMSFGCCECDVIFGDFYVLDATLEAGYDEGKLQSFELKLDV